MESWIFPGQGSQQKGMGNKLFDDFADLTAKADCILDYSIKELCLQDNENKLSQTQYTQPALFIVNALSFFKKISEINKKPDFVAGHSLGEYNALLAAEVFDFETGLKLVKKRGELMSKVSSGAMAAVINYPKDKIIEILHSNNLLEVDIANFNSPSQIVVSGLSEQIQQAVRVFKDKKIQCIQLNVSGAFHSRYMEPCKIEFEEFLADFKFSEIKIPVISNVQAKPYEQAGIVKNLADQINHSVKWTQSIIYLIENGVDNFEEIGHGRVLTSLIAKIKIEHKKNN